MVVFFWLLADRRVERRQREEIGRGGALPELDRREGDGGHVGQQERDRLEVADRLAEGGALFGVGAGVLEGGPGDSDRAGGGDQAEPVVERAQQRGQLAGRVEPGGGGNLRSLDDD